MTCLRTVLLLVVVTSCATPVLLVPLPEPGDGPTPLLFASHDVFVLELEIPLATLLGDRSQDSSERPGRLRYRDSNTGPVTLDVGVRTRGRYRLNPSRCGFPPLRLDFKRRQVQDTVFAGQNRLKLVTHCKGSARYLQYLLSEYLLYRTHNLLTERSFRVRLAQITYLDSDGEHDPLTHNAFFIESEGQVGERNGLEPLDVPELAFDAFELEALALVEVFQYMIGNTDWSVLRGPRGEDCCHNTKVLGGNGSGVVPIPYDFDFAGAIATHYALPPPSLPIDSVRTRLYRGSCASVPALDSAFAHFNARRSAIRELYRSQAGLDPGRRERTLAYYDRFYETINDTEEVRKRLVGKCRTSRASG